MQLGCWLHPLDDPDDDDDEPLLLLLVLLPPLLVLPLDDPAGVVSEHSLTETGSFSPA